jgi:hypothetical protein
MPPRIDPFEAINVVTPSDARFAGRGGKAVEGDP